MDAAVQECVGPLPSAFLCAVCASVPACLSVDVYEVLAASHYTLLTKEEWDLATSENFNLNLPMEVRSRYKTCRRGAHTVSCHVCMPCTLAQCAPYLSRMCAGELAIHPSMQAVRSSRGLPQHVP